MIQSTDAVAIELPKPRTDSSFAVERALIARRSVRSFGGSALTLAETSQVLWAAQGVTHASGLRTAPSAGALYPIELHLVVGNVQQLATGIYRYDPWQHALVRHVREDKRLMLAKAAYDRNWIAGAQAIVAVTSVPARSAPKYGERSVRYTYMEAGHATQNVLLQATALDLAATAVGAFDDAGMGAVLGLPACEHPLYLIALGRPR